MLRADWRVNGAPEFLRDSFPASVLAGLIIQSSKVDSLVHKADWLALRTMARCEKAM